MSHYYSEYPLRYLLHYKCPDWWKDMGFLWMKVYSAHCTQNIVNINKTQYKQIYLKFYKLVYYHCVLVGRYQWPMGFTTFRLMMIYLIHKLHHYLQSWSSPRQIILNVSIEVRMSLLRELITSVFLYGCET